MDASGFESVSTREHGLAHTQGSVSRVCVLVLKLLNSLELLSGCTGFNRIYYASINGIAKSVLHYLPVV